jgi:hypothetical protein
MTCSDVAISIENFLHQPSSSAYSVIEQPSISNNWIALLEGGKLIPFFIEQNKIEPHLDDSHLLRLGQLTIEPLLAEDWNSPEDDVWDSI